MQVTLSAPPGTHGELILPNPDTSLVLTLNGEVVWRNGSPLASNAVLQAGELRLTLSGGHYILRATQDCPPAS